MKPLNLPSIFGILFLAALLNSCFESRDGTRYEPSPPPPMNITAVAGDRMAIVSWLFFYDAVKDSAYYSVSYPDSGNGDCGAGGAGTHCVLSTTGYASIQRFIPDRQAYESDTVYGLTNGQTYVFTVRGQEGSSDSSASYGNSNAVTPMAP